MVGNVGQSRFLTLSSRQLQARSLPSTRPVRRSRGPRCEGPQKIRHNSWRNRRIRRCVIYARPRAGTAPRTMPERGPTVPLRNAAIWAKSSAALPAHCLLGRLGIAERDCAEAQPGARVNLQALMQPLARDYSLRLPTPCLIEVSIEAVKLCTVEFDFGRMIRSSFTLENFNDSTSLRDY